MVWWVSNESKTERDQATINSDMLKSQCTSDKTEQNLKPKKQNMKYFTEKCSSCTNGQVLFKYINSAIPFGKIFSFWSDDPVNESLNVLSMGIRGGGHYWSDGDDLAAAGSIAEHEDHLHLFDLSFSEGVIS